MGLGFVFSPKPYGGQLIMQSNQARVWSNLADWYAQSRRWIRAAPVDGNASISPDFAKACEPNTWEITYVVGNTPLSAGAHISVEIPLSWKIDLGRIFSVKHLMLPGEASAGYGVLVEAAASRDDVKTDVAISDLSRFSVVDVAIAEGALQEGDWVKIILGGTESSKMRAQKYAQRAIFTLGVDVSGNGTYRRVPEFPSVSVVGGFAAGLRVVAPATVEPDKPFEIDVMPIDSYNHNPASEYNAQVSLMSSSKSLWVPSKCRFAPEGPSIVALKDIKATGRGVFRVTAMDEENALIGRSNPIGAGFSDEGHIYFGDIHGQVYESIGTGTTEEYYQWGRDVERLDFCATANHYGGRYDPTPDIWNRVVHISNRYYQPGKFVTFISFEWGSGHVGHRNVYYKGSEGDLFPAFVEESNSLEKLWKLLEGRDVLTIPHHPKYCGRADWTLRNDDLQRLVEICSMWGISESGGIHSVQYALSKGHRLGFIGGTDTHFGQPGHGSHGVNEGRGLAAVYAGELTRPAIFDALRDRHCYATTGDRILLNFRVNDARMGEEVEIPEGMPRKIAVRAEGTGPIEKVEIIRNNQVVYTYAERGLSAEFEWEDGAPFSQIAMSPAYEGDVPFVFYYCRLTQENGQMAWSSPVWFLLSESPSHSGCE